jgi:hypothetical protein
VNLTTVGLLAPHLTVENHCELLEAARHKSKREVEHLVAALRPQADVPSKVRKLPAPTPAAALAGLATVPDAPWPTHVPAVHPAPRPVVAPVAPERYKFQFTVTRETYDKLRSAQDLLRHSIPNGDPAAIFDRALTLLLETVTRTKLAASSRPREGRPPAPESRHIPAAVKREVWKRDGGRCAFVGPNGRCSETGFIEFHHVVPYAAGGQAVAENVELRCRAHNVYEAEQFFGSPLFVRETPALFAEVSRLGPDLVRQRAVKDGFEEAGALCL